MNKLCDYCGSDLVYLTKDTLDEIREMVKPNFKTLSTKMVAKFGGVCSICPVCDAYALGIELNTGFPIIFYNGTLGTIHDLS
ncbi:MAG: hypothetical protein FHK82_17810 [Sedimenticola thiotaurini]|uniref:Uncharacterized protein n=1 Tax=Sedimenticola thiotaurini TaxID=1543721 RepID=A0A558CH58_9GAMM|nr:MAG: hypothetical protein FHK82_17810 [Sedimenticola thiotaurini]